MKNLTIILICGLFAFYSCNQRPKQQATSENISVCQNDTLFVGLPETEENIENSSANIELIENKSLTRNNIWDFVDEKAEWFKKGLEPQTDTKLLPSNFKTFFEKFRTDSVFQIDNILFDRLIGVVAECDTTIILNSQNWEMLTWDIVNNLKEYPNSIEQFNNYFFSDSTRVLFEFELIEFGVISRFGFEKINGKWKHTLHYAGVC